MAKMFFAYPNEPLQLGDTIERAVSIMNQNEEKVKSWKALSIVGRFIESEIVNTIADRVFVADITFLNFNVIYEIGYAIGKGRKILLVKNRQFQETPPTILQLGIFDTLGYLEYENANDLVTILRHQNPNNPRGVDMSINRTAPVYLLENKYKDDFLTRVLARVKKARLGFRSFDPNESPRLSALDAISQVSQSAGILLTLIPSVSKDSKIHNFRTAFVAGLSNGMKKILYILQHGTDVIPIDLRDFVVICYSIDDANEPIANFAMDVVDEMQNDESFKKTHIKNVLEKINIGASSAENEMRTLHFYYLKTDAYFRAMRGEVQLVVGRKGSGKTAIFIQIRDNERSKSDNLVLDLMPDGYQLIKFKQQVLDYLEEGTLEHTITGFWEYILLLEICHKVLDSDRKKHYYDQELHQKYLKLEKLYGHEEYVTEGDFSERMARLMDSISENFSKKFSGNKNIRLSDPEVTGLLYRKDVRPLRSALVEYLSSKNKIWLLFDNIDKGWPTNGLQRADLIIIRSLIDAVRKIQRFLIRHKIDFFPVIFLRNDIYDLLVAQSPDRQKEAKVLLDWTDPDLLRQIISLRIRTNTEINDNDNIDGLWRQICVSHYNGEDSLTYLIDRSLMRPRFLLNLINHCRSFAVNLNHSKIQQEDIDKGLQAYSHDLVQDIKFEMQDVFPEAAGVLTLFVNGKSEMSVLKFKELLFPEMKSPESVEKVIDLLLWYGFIGIALGDEVKYLYSLNYDMDVLKSLIKKSGDDATFVINPAFRPALLLN